MDVETTGTDVECDHLLEFAAAVTDMSGCQHGPSFSRLLTPPHSVASMIEIATPHVRAMHEKSGLWMDLYNNTTTSALHCGYQATQWLSSIVDNTDSHNETPTSPHPPMPPHPYHTATPAIKTTPYTPHDTHHVHQAATMVSPHQTAWPHRDDTMTLYSIDKDIHDTASPYRHLCPPHLIVVGGNSLVLDREFVRAAMPTFYARLSHRSIDVTSIALTVQAVTGRPTLGYRKQGRHRALPDVLDSIREYRHYVDMIQAHTSQQPSSTQNQ